jgi:hypothetical protein
MAKLRQLLRRLMAVSAPVALLLLETAGYRIRTPSAPPLRRAQQADHAGQVEGKRPVQDPQARFEELPRRRAHSPRCRNRIGPQFADL